MSRTKSGGGASGAGGGGRRSHGERMKAASGAGPRGEPHEDADSRWYTATEEEELATRLTREVHRLRENQGGRREMYRFLLEQHGLTEMASLGVSSHESAAVFQAPTMPFNVVRRGVSTVYAKCAKNRPLPMVLSTRGDYKAGKRARGLTNFLGGLFQHLNVPRDVSQPACKFALVVGTGIAHVYHVEGDQFPRTDIVFPWEFFISPAEAQYGKPKSFYMVRWVDRRILREKYPEWAEEIEDATGRDMLSRGNAVDSADIADLVLVYYGWRVATQVAGGKRGKTQPGKWAVAIDGALLDSGDYTRTYPPFAFLRYQRPLIGFYGESLASEMVGFQYELNFTTDTLRMSHRTAPAGIWVTSDNTGIPDAAYSNEIGYVLKKRPGTELEYYNPTPAGPQTYQWHTTLSEGALRWSGISTMSANAEKPAGVTASVALNTLDDIESDNFAIFQQDYEQFHVDLANLYIDEMKSIAEDNPDAAVLVQDKRSVIEVDWVSVDMPRDAIILQIFPVALLGRTPAARRQQVADLFKDGVIDRSLYLKLLDAPDIDAEVDLDAATRTLVDEQIDHILDAKDPEASGAYQYPMPFTDLVYALRRATQQVCLATIQKRPEGNLSLLRQYIEGCKRELKKQHEDENAMNPPPPPSGLPPGMPPGAGPGAIQPGMMAPPPPVNAAALPPGASPGGMIPS